MPLSRQLILSLFAVLLAVFIGTLLINVSNTQQSIEKQLASHAQDTATSFGLSISPYVGNNKDLPLVETMMNAIFDSGYYQSLVLQDAQNNILLQKRNPSSVKGVPEWFVQWFPLQPPEVTSEINDGWTIAAVIKVQSHPGTGYQQLWHNTTDSFTLIAIIFAVAWVLLLILIRLITSPISVVVKQLEIMGEHQLEPIHLSPKVLELKIFVQAFNNMSKRLNELFSKLSSQTERYRQFAYIDKLTQVGNRRAFDLAFDALLSDTEQQPHGFLILIRLSSLNQVNSKIGFSDGDAYIKNVSQTVQQLTHEQSTPATLYRLNGADLCLVLEEIEEIQGIAVTQNLVNKCNAIEKSEYELGTVHVGASAFSFSDDKAEILEKVDSALTNAASSEQRWQLASQLNHIQSNNLWREQISLLIQNKRADFVAQPIQSFASQIEYQEWFARFCAPNDDQYLPMSELMPVSIRLDFAQQLDELVVRCALEKAKHNSGKVGLNLSRIAILKPEFQVWFLEQLSTHGEHCKRLVIEIPERTLVADIESLTHFVSQLKKLGVSITVERFGAQFAAFAQLRKIRPDYLKIDGRYIKSIDTERDNQLFVHSLVNIAHGLGIKIIAERVETEQEAQTLKNLQVDFLQGYLLSTPTSV